MAAVTKNSPNLKKSSSQELLRRFIPNFIFKVLHDRSTKFVQIKSLGAVMAELQGRQLGTCAYIQNSSKIFFSRTSEQISTKFHIKGPRLKMYQVCSNGALMTELQVRELCTCANIQNSSKIFFS